MSSQERISLQSAAAACLRGETPDSAGCPRDEIRQRRALQQLAGVVKLFVDGRGGAAHSPLPPSQWGHLRVEQRIGEGAFGSVFRAHDTVLHRDVSLKLQRSDSIEQNGQAYIEEARRLARVRHPNVLAVHGADMFEGRVGLWADLLIGETLAVRLGEQRCFDAAEVLELAGQLAAALTAVHGAHLCHGDIKPANVMCEADGRYVLMDFGAAREHTHNDRFHYGTPRFMSPERLRLDLPPSQPDDLFAVGVILYRAALGHYPPRIRLDDDDPQPHGCGSEVEWPLLRRALGAPLARLIADLLSTEPSRRPTASRLRERYRQLRELPARQRRRRAWGVVIASLSLGLIAALSGLYTAQQARLREAAERERAEQVSEFLRGWLSAPQAEYLGRQVRVLDLLGDAERELAAKPPQQRELRSELRLLLARTLAGLGEFERAEALLQMVLQDYPESVNTAFPRLRALSLLSAVEEDRGDSAAAEQRRADLIAQLQTSDYAGGELHLRSLMEQADLAISRGELDAAEALLSDGQRGTAALTDRALADELNDLLRVSRIGLLSARGQFAEAASLAEQSLQAAIALHGERHSSVFVARNRWVEALAQGGQLAAAEAPARANLAAARDWLGDEDRYTLAALVALGNVLDDGGHHIEALEARREALTRADRLPGASPTDRAQARINLANSLKESGQREEAIALYRQVVAAGADSEINPIAVLMAQSNLSEALVEDRQFAAAADNARDSLQRMRAALGEGHPFVGHAQAMLGAALTGLGDAAAGLNELDAAYAIVAQSIGEENPLAADIAWYRAEALQSKGEHDAAREQLNVLLQRQRGLYAAEHPDVRRTEARLHALDNAE